MSASAPSPSSPASCMRIVGMSGWIMWVVAGIFENIGVVQEGMETIAAPNQVRRSARTAGRWRCAQGEIRFDDVSFHYGRTASAGRRPGAGGVIHDLSLHDQAGREGRPGRPLGRRQVDARQPAAALLRPGGGRILIDGQDIAHVTQDSLRAQIGMVTQDTSLLHRSVRDNILYGRPDAGEAAAVAAAKQAQAARVHRAGSRT